MSIIIKNTNIYLNHGSILENAYICIVGNIIKEITKDKEIADNFNEKYKLNDLTYINGNDMLVMPGLVNAHTHSPMTVLRNYGSDKTLHDWLFNKIIPKEQLMNPEDVYLGSVAGQLEMIKSGTTCFADMYEPFESLAQAVSETGMRANLCAAVLSNRWEGNKKETYSKYDSADRLISKWNGACDGKIKTYAELHSVYLYDTDMLYNCVNLAKTHNIGIHSHLHETQKEIDDCMKENKKRPIEVFEDLGVFDVPVIAAHCVHTDRNDRKILFEHNVSCVHNPTSNMKLASGFAPIPEMIEEEINVALGTDGAASNNNLNMFEEMHIASLIHKGFRKDPTLLPAKQIIEMATSNGYKALGFKDNFGEVKEGNIADLIMINLNELHLNPINDISSAIVYSMQSQDVDTVIIDGTIVMKNRNVLNVDEEMIRYKINQIAKKLHLSD